MKRLALFAVGFALLVGVAAQAEPSSCLMVNRIRGWGILDKHSIVAEDMTHRAFKVTYSGYCGNLNFELEVQFKSVVGVQGCLQRGDRITVRSRQGEFSCMIQAVDPLLSAQSDTKEPAPSEPSPAG